MGQFERFTRQKQINKHYFKEEIVSVCQQFRDHLCDEWDVRKSAKFELVKFGNKKLIRKYTVPINKEVTEKDKKEETKKDKQKKKKSKNNRSSFQIFRSYIFC